jgi:hypothetical protein
LPNFPGSFFDLKVTRGRADEMRVAPKTRLDPLVRLSEKNETQQLQKLAAATRQLEEANQRVEAARAESRREHRSTDAVAFWQIAESAQVRALAEERLAEKNANAAAEALKTTQDGYRETQLRTKSLRNAADNRRTLIVREMDRKEARQNEDAFLYARKNKGQAA